MLLRVAIVVLLGDLVDEYRLTIDDTHLLSVIDYDLQKPKLEKK